MASVASGIWEPFGRVRLDDDGDVWPVRKHVRVRIAGGGCNFRSRRTGGVSSTQSSVGSGAAYVLCWARAPSGRWWRPCWLVVGVRGVGPAVVTIGGSASAGPLRLSPHPTERRHMHAAH